MEWENEVGSEEELSGMQEKGIRWTKRGRTLSGMLRKKERECIVRSVLTERGMKG